MEGRKFSEIVLRVTLREFAFLLDITKRNELDALSISLKVLTFWRYSHENTDVFWTQSTKNINHMVPLGDNNMNDKLNYIYIIF